MFQRPSLVPNARLTLAAPGQFYHRVPGTKKGNKKASVLPPRRVDFEARIRNLFPAGLLAGKFEKSKFMDDVVPSKKNGTGPPSTTLSPPTSPPFLLRSNSRSTSRARSSSPLYGGLPPPGLHVNGVGKRGGSKRARRVRFPSFTGSLFSRGHDEEQDGKLTRSLHSLRNSCSCSTKIGIQASIG